MPIPVRLAILVLLFAVGAACGAEIIDVSAGLPNKVRVVAGVPGQNKVLAFSGKEWGPSSGSRLVEGMSRHNRPRRNRGCDVALPEYLHRLLFPALQDRDYACNRPISARSRLVRRH
jgi:hypothetical protein